jgi:hypothetical protein
MAQTEQFTGRAIPWILLSAAVALGLLALAVLR